MATAPKQIVLRKEDYRDAPGWLERLFLQLNDFLTATASALTRGLTRAENLQSVVKSVEFTTSGTPGDTFPILVKHGLPTRPVDVWVGQLREDSGAAITSAWSFTWDLETGGNLSIRFQGLSGSTKYKARLVIE